MQGKLQDGSVIISGALGTDAELKTVGDKNTLLAKFSVAVGQRPSVKADESAQTIWVYCQCWGELARAAGLLKKGDRVLCCGRVETREYNGKEYKTLNCDFITRALSKAPSAANAASAPLPAELAEGFEEILSDDGVPF